MRTVAASLTVLLALGCAGEEAPTDPLVDGPFAEIELDLTIPPHILSPADAPSDRLVEVLPMLDGSVWILDWLEEESRIRRFDAEGLPIDEVGSSGFEVGQHLVPEQLGRLADGRVVMVDPGMVGRFTIYNPDGTVWAEAPHTDTMVWDQRGIFQIDEQDQVWTLMRERMTPPRSRLPAFFARKRVDGTTVDTIRFPEFPEVQQDRVVIPGLSANQVFLMPFQPVLSWAVDPAGRFAMNVGSDYEILRYGPPGGDRDATEVFVSRDPTPIRVTRGERRQLRDSLQARVARITELEVDIPEVEEIKPPVRGFQYSVDGRLLVHVHLPSQLEGDVWVEPNGWDVFERDGTFRGRIILPPDVEVQDLDGDTLWGVRTASNGAVSVLRYRITWPTD